MATDTPSDRATLKGMKEVHVIVEPIDSDAERDGLTASQLLTDVELRLRQSGIRVVDKAPDVPVLYVNLNAMKESILKGYVYAYDVRVEVLQDCRVVANDAHSFAETWSASAIAVVGMTKFPRFARDSVQALTDKFINAYFSVNPKP